MFFCAYDDHPENRLMEIGLYTAFDYIATSTKTGYVSLNFLMELDSVYGNTRLKAFNKCKESRHQPSQLQRNKAKEAIACASF